MYDVLMLIVIAVLFATTFGLARLCEWVRPK
jgi:hypothetical protein